MKNLMLVEKPEAKNDAALQWWPDLYLKMGRKLMQIQPEQCAKVREMYNGGRGSSEIARDVMLHSMDGEEIGHVSYNGRVWMHDIEGDIEIPVKG